MYVDFPGAVHGSPLGELSAKLTERVPQAARWQEDRCESPLRYPSSVILLRKMPPSLWGRQAGVGFPAYKIIFPHTPVYSRNPLTTGDFCAKMNRNARMEKQYRSFFCSREWAFGWEPMQRSSGRTFPERAYKDFSEIAGTAPPNGAAKGGTPPKLGGTTKHYALVPRGRGFFIFLWVFPIIFHNRIKQYFPERNDHYGQNQTPHPVGLYGASA